MSLQDRKEELVKALEVAREQATLAAINIQRIEGAIALLDVLLTEEAEGTDEDVSTGD